MELQSHPSIGQSTRHRGRRFPARMVFTELAAWVRTAQQLSASTDVVSSKPFRVAVLRMLHGRPHAGLPAAFAERQRRVLATLVTVMDHVARPALTDCHFQRIDYQLSTQMVCHRPADDLAAPGI
jgi:hypothetical protein